MKIIIDARLYGLENAGLGRYAMNLVKHLGIIDHKNEYLIILRKKYFNLLNFPSNFQKILFDFRHYSFAEQIYLPRLLFRYKADLVHFPHFNAPIFFRGKFIVTIHDMLMHENKGSKATTLDPFTYFIKRIGHKFVFKFVLEKAKKIIVPSQFVKGQLRQRFGITKNRIDVIYEGIDESFYPKNDTKMVLTKYNIDKEYFIYTGNAYPHKNLKQAIDAIIHLNKKLIHKTLLMIASSRDVFVKRLGVYIKDLKAEKFVRLLGFVPDKDLASLYKNSQAFLFPSLSEGFGLTGLEAMASGTLVLASDIPVFREVYKDKAIYFNPLDSSSIEKAMKDALEMNSSKRTLMIQEGQKFSKRYSWSKMAAETLKLYRSGLE